MNFRRLFTVFTAVLLIGIWAGTVWAGPPQGNPPGLAVAREALAKHRNELHGVKDVVGSGISADENGQAVIVAFTATPGPHGLPKSLDGVPVLDTYTGRFYALVPSPCTGALASRPPECFENPPDPEIDPTSRFERPVPIGVSTGHPQITAGTIGARVVGDRGEVYVLSNNHVLANQNDASLGDPIIQPGIVDGGVVGADTYASLFDFEPMYFDENMNAMDAAIALSSVYELGNSTPSDGYGVPSSQTVQPEINQSVQKYGRTTGLTQGVVQEIDATVLVCYNDTCTKQASFFNQITIVGGTFSDGGDSGSLVVTTEGNNPVGLLFAGSSTRTIATPIDTVLARFNVVVDDGQNQIPAQLANITVMPPSPVIGIDQTLQFTAIGNYADGTNADITDSVTWSSTDTDVATITSSGLATGHAEGEAGISAQNGTIQSEPNYMMVRPITSSITLLNADGYKIKALKEVHLAWADSPAGTVVIWRDNEQFTTENDGAYIDYIGKSVDNTFVYKVCDEYTCSDEMVVNF